jgi:hypothetical protein
VSTVAGNFYQAPVPDKGGKKYFWVPLRISVGMKFFTPLLFTVFLFVTSASVAQSKAENASTEPPAPLIILQHADEKIVFDPKKGEFLNDSAIKTEAIASIDIVSVERATDLYGNRGANGAIVITLKDEYIITKESVLRIDAPVQ